MNGDRLTLIGWREWVSLPDLGVSTIKAKIDTGARSSSLHVVDIETEQRDDGTYVKFRVEPNQRSSKESVCAEARVLEYRQVRSSSGEVSERPVILTKLRIFEQDWPIELTLANRDEMGFRMLLGREALRGRLLVDPGKSYYNGRRKRRTR